MQRIPKEKVRGHWTAFAKERLVGRTVVGVRYMTAEECEDFGWHDSALVIFFDDDTYIIPKQDDEANNAGSVIGGNAETDWTYPVISAHTPAGDVELATVHDGGE